MTTAWLQHRGGATVVIVGRSWRRRPRVAAEPDRPVFRTPLTAFLRIPAQGADTSVRLATADDGRRNCP